MKKHVLYLDILKILAIFLVILLHCAGSMFSKVPTTSYEFLIFNIYDSLARIAVPIFFMVSGVYFLNPENKIDIKKIYKKYILRIILVFIVSSCFLEIINYFLDPSIISTRNFIKSIIVGDDILWFFYAIVGLYIITPLLREITKSKRSTEYFLILFFILGVLIPSVNNLFPIELTRTIISKLAFQLVMGYSGYYMLGYYLSKYELSKKQRYITYILGIVGLILTFALTQILSMKLGKPDITFYKNMSITVFFTAISVFLLFSNSSLNKKYSDKKILLLASLTIYIYPIHKILINIFEHFKITTTIINPIIMIPVYTIILFVLSTCLSIVISKILEKIKDKPKTKIAIFTLIIIITIVLFWFIRSTLR